MRNRKVSDFTTLDGKHLSFEDMAGMRIHNNPHKEISIDYFKFIPGKTEKDKLIYMALRLKFCKKEICRAFNISISTLKRKKKKFFL